MSSALLIGGFLDSDEVRQVTTRGVCYFASGITSVAQLLPTDAQGTFALTLLNVAVGSAIQVEIAASGAVVINTTAASSTVGLSIPAYIAGSIYNNLRIKVRKGSASPYYQPYETLATAFVGSSSIYVSQISDE